MTFLSPELNSILNAISAVLLGAGFFFILTGRWRRHAAMMISATAVSTAFLAFYLLYHLEHGEKSTKLSHAPHWLRNLYLAVLLPHLLMAVVMLPMIYLTLYRAFRRDWAGHHRIALPTFWVWMYVSVSGVVVYFLLYHTALAS